MILVAVLPAELFVLIFIAAEFPLKIQAIYFSLGDSSFVYRRFYFLQSDNVHWSPMFFVSILKLIVDCSVKIPPRKPRK